MISAEQFAEWKTHPVTKEIFAELTELRDQLKDKLIDGITIDYGAEYIYGLTNKIVGQIAGIEQLLNISYEREETKEQVNDQSGY